MTMRVTRALSVAGLDRHGLRPRDDGAEVRPSRVNVASSRVNVAVVRDIAGPSCVIANEVKQSISPAAPAMGTSQWRDGQWPA